MLPRMVDILDEPIGDPAAINTLLMCDAARDAGVKVLLSGMGADELFGGYRKHLAMLVAARYRRMPGAVRVRCRPRPCGPSPSRSAAAACARSAGRSASSPSPSCPSRRRSGAATPSTTATSSPACSTPSLAGHVDTVIDRHREVYDDNDLDDVVSRMCLADTRMFMPGLNLTYTDRASMAASTEVRVPFVDPVVMAAAFSLPDTEKIRGRQQKAALKDAARAWLPDEIIDRPKASFGAPLRAWVTNDLRELVDDVLLARRARRQRASSGGAAAAAGRRPAQRAARRGQAGVAAAEPRALVPQRPRCRGRARHDAQETRRCATQKPEAEEVAMKQVAPELPVR